MTGTSVTFESSPVLEISDLTVRRGSRSVLAGVNLQVHAGESVALMGPSGSGKTTLLSCILGLTSPKAGIIRVSGETVNPKRRAAVAAMRRRLLGVVFQAGELLPELTPVENVLVAALLHGTPYQEAQERAYELLGMLAVPHDRTSIAELSGGERQRVAVARALINSPVLLLADEPTGSLDSATRDATLGLLLNVSREHGCAIVIVTHDQEVASRANRQFYLTDGRIEEFVGLTAHSKACR